MKPPFQYPRRAEADNFRVKLKLVLSAFRSPIYHGWFASAAERTRLTGKWVFFGSDRPSKPILEFRSSKPQACHGPRPGFLCRLCGWGSRWGSASKFQKMGRFHSDPIAADGFWGLRRGLGPPSRCRGHRATAVERGAKPDGRDGAHA